MNNDSKNFPTMSNTTKAWVDAIFYLIAFIFIQMATMYIIKFAVNTATGIPLAHTWGETAAVKEQWNTSVLILSTALSAVITIGIFLWRKWAPFSREYIRTRPWGVLFWVVFLTIGTILPSEWVVEKLEFYFPIFHVDESDFHNLITLMKSPFGYLIVGILAPICEEMVFRGAILRSLMKSFSNKMHWWPIIFSALIFALVHLNFLQGFHAFFMGLLLGWMYYRTNSILPGIVFHWMNNTVSFLMIKLMPQMADGKLIDLFHGDDRLMAGGVFFSLCIFIPSLLQLFVKLKKQI